MLTSRVVMKMNECFGCGFYDCDLGCSCTDDWLCPLNPEPELSEFEKSQEELEEREKERNKKE